MLGRGHFVYKRHRNLFERDSISPPTQADATAAPSGNANTPDSVTPVTPTVLSPQSTNSPSASASASASPPTSPSPSPSSAPSSATTTAASSNTLVASSTATSLVPSSSASHAVSSSASSSSPVSPTSSANSLPLTTQIAPGVSFTPTSTLSQSASATPSSGSSGDTSTGTIVGYVAGILAGIAVLGLLLMWCMRRQRNRDVDDFDAQAFKRQSAILVDDPVESSQSYDARPPTMIERHNASPALAAQSGHGGQNFYGSYGGYGQQSYPPEMPPSAASPPQPVYASPGFAGYDESHQQIARQPSNVGYGDHDSQQQLTRQHSNGQYLTRQPSAAVGYTPPIAPPSSFNQNAHYIDLSRSSVSPYQAAQYADISRQLGSADPNEHGHHEGDELPDGPLPSPFDDPGMAAPALHQRPAVHFQDSDAYGGI